MRCSKYDKCAAVHVEELFVLPFSIYAQCYRDAHRGKGRISHCLHRQAMPCSCMSMESKQHVGAPTWGQHSTALLSNTRASSSVASSTAAFHKRTDSG